MSESPRTRTTDAQPPEPDPQQQLIGMRRTILALGTTVITERAARQRLAKDVQQLRAELSQARAAIRNRR
jgi:hypothetical protein